MTYDQANHTHIQLRAMKNSYNIQPSIQSRLRAIVHSHSLRNSHIHLYTSFILKTHSRSWTAALIYSLRADMLTTSSLIVLVTEVTFCVFNLGIGLLGISGRVVKVRSNNSHSTPA